MAITDLCRNGEQELSTTSTEMRRGMGKDTSARQDMGLKTNTPADLPEAVGPVAVNPADIAKLANAV